MIPAFDREDIDYDNNDDNDNNNDNDNDDDNDNDHDDDDDDEVGGWFIGAPNSAIGQNKTKLLFFSLESENVEQWNFLAEWYKKFPLQYCCTLGLKLSMILLIGQLTQIY